MFCSRVYNRPTSQTLMPTSTEGVPTLRPRTRAITDLDKTIQLKPDHTTAYFFRGNAYTTRRL